MALSIPRDATHRGVVVEVKPGNETEIGAEIGGAPHESLWLRATYSGLFAAASEDRTVDEFVAPREQRQLHTVELGAYWRLGRWLPGAVADGLAVDVWYRHPIGGVDYLRGGAVGMGVALETHKRRAGPPEARPVASAPIRNMRGGV